jgi:Fis family transcriptional regulator, factor for inversion stimulation protein
MSDAAPLPLVRKHTLRDSVRSTIGEYLQDVDEDFISGLHAMVLAEVEAPLLEAVMLKARSNQSTAARMLGLNRSTLRKKLRLYGLL